jgi:hypothetical protein
MPRGSKDACSPTQPARLGWASSQGVAVDLAIIVTALCATWVDPVRGDTCDDRETKVDAREPAGVTKPNIFKGAWIVYVSETEIAKATVLCEPGE